MNRYLPFIVLLLAFLGLVGYLGYSVYLDRKGPDYPSDPAVYDLVVGLKSWEGDQRVSAAERLVDMGPAAAEAAPHLVHALRTGDEDLRVNATLALGRMGKAIVPDLVKGMNDSSSDVRFYAVWAVGLIGPDAAEQAGDAVLRHLEDSRQDVRRKAAESLGRMAPAVPDAVPALADTLGDSSEDVQKAAADALARYGKPGAKALLEALDKHPALRRQLVQALGKMRGEADDVAPALVALLRQQGKNGKPDGLRWELSQAIVGLGKSAVPPLAEGINDADPQTRAACLEVLAQMGADAAAALVDALQSEHADVRRSAAQHLGGLGVGDNLVIIALQAALQDRDNQVRQNATFALRRLGHPPR
jgi:hypothetical protein